MDRKKPTPRGDEENPQPVGGGKSKKKNLVLEDIEYSVGTELSEESQVQEVVPPPSKGKKGKKGNSKAAKGVDEEPEVAGEDEDEVPQVVFTGKKKGESKMGFGSLEDEDKDGEQSAVTGDDDEEEEEAVKFSGKKKPSKSSKKTGGSLFTGSAFDAIGDEGDNDGDVDDDVAGKINAVEDTSLLKPTAAGDDTVGNENSSMITFTGKKKSSKKKGNSVPTALGEDAGVGSEIADVVEPEPPATASIKIEADNSNSKKKKKNNVRTAQDEDGLDKILAELGEVPSNPAAPQKEEKVEVQPADSQIEEKLEVHSDAVAPVGSEIADVVEPEPPATASIEIEADNSNNKIKKKNNVRTAQDEDGLGKILAELGEVPSNPAAPQKEEKVEVQPADSQIEEKLEVHSDAVTPVDGYAAKKAESKTVESAKEKEKKAGAAESKIEPAIEPKKKELKESAAEMKVPKYDREMQEALARQQEEEERKKNEEERRKQEDLEKQKEEAKQNKKDRGEIQELKKVGLYKTPNQNEQDELNTDQFLNNDPNSVEGVPHTTDNEPAPNQANGTATTETVEITEESVDMKSAISVQKSIPSQPIKPHDVEKPKKQSEVEADKGKKKDDVPRNSVYAPKEDEDSLRSPICCIIGHVGTGKTELLNCIQGTSVQEDEAGGITQPCGASYIHAADICERTKELKADARLKVPGLLVIDTLLDGTSTDLRPRKSSLCDIAVLVVDIRHGLEGHTRETLEHLNTKFIVALNKVDMLSGWKTCHNQPIGKALEQQSKDVVDEYIRRVEQIINQFKQLGFDTELYNENNIMGETYRRYSIVPTSAISGEGIPDLLLQLVQWAQKINEIQCKVLAVDKIEDSTTIDAVLVYGVLHKGDKIVLSGKKGCMITSIEALATPHPNKELRSRGTYSYHSQIEAARGIKITVQGLASAIPGTSLYVVGPGDNLDAIKQTAMEDRKSVLSLIDERKNYCGVAKKLKSSPHHPLSFGFQEASAEDLTMGSDPVSGVCLPRVQDSSTQDALDLKRKKNSSMENSSLADTVKDDNQRLNGKRVRFESAVQAGSSGGARKKSADNVDLETSEQRHLAASESNTRGTVELSSTQHDSTHLSESVVRTNTNLSSDMIERDHLIEMNYLLPVVTALANSYEAKLPEKKRVSRKWTICSLISFLIRGACEIALAFREFKTGNSNAIISITLACIIVSMNILELEVIRRHWPVSKDKLNFALACLIVSIAEVWYFSTKLEGRKKAPHIMILPCAYNAVVVFTGVGFLGATKGWWSNLASYVASICKGWWSNLAS